MRIKEKIRERIWLIKIEKRYKSDENKRIKEKKRK